MNQLQKVFNYKGKEIRTVIKDNDPWWVAKDVCEVLEIDTTQTRRLDEDEKGMCLIQTPGGKQEMTIVNEPGLYTLILGSRKPEAKEFKRWVTHEVLPSIRKTGIYSLNPNPNRSSYGDLAALMKEWRAWAKAMNMPMYLAMKYLIQYLKDKGEPISEEMAYISPWVQEQLPIQRINIFNLNK
ncbi:MAG: Bro-N domain-containing protein [Clostridiales bacterium]|jgi:anti-repressor protein|nr:Bro-N domain-containing protein [Eubacteriales bacterium]MDH7566895.1 Bro-N domain-containing protein [Clostridiales bacterium]